MGFGGFLWVLLSFTEFYEVFAGFKWVSVDFTEF